MTRRHALITGASSGIGAALARGYAERGFDLTISARRLDRLLELKDALHRSHPGSEVLVIEADVRDKNASRRLVDESVKRFLKLDIFVANAGLGMWSRFRDMGDPDQMLELMMINYMGVVYGLHYSLPHLRRVRGSFAAISSVQGILPVIYHTGYVASKFAVNGLIETIRLEEKDVHFLLAMPGWIAGTELRSHSIEGQGPKAIHVEAGHGRGAIPVDECAERIISAIAARRKELFIPKKFCLIPLLRYMFKAAFDRLVTRMVEGQLKKS